MYRAQELRGDQVPSSYSKLRNVQHGGLSRPCPAGCVQAQLTLLGEGGVAWTYWGTSLADGKKNNRTPGTALLSASNSASSWPIYTSISFTCLRIQWPSPYESHPNMPPSLWVIFHPGQYHKKWLGAPASLGQWHFLYFNTTCASAVRRKEVAGIWCRDGIGCVLDLLPFRSEMLGRRHTRGQRMSCCGL